MYFWLNRDVMHRCIEEMKKRLDGEWATRSWIKLVTASNTLTSPLFVPSLEQASPLTLPYFAHYFASVSYTMGHGNSDKLYVTHAEHSGMFGQHTASSAGFKAWVCSSARMFDPPPKKLTAHVTLGRLKHPIPERGLPLIVVHCHFNHSIIPSVLGMRMGQVWCSISSISFLG